jgi:NOL1/NOP2/sun family putative RNA methylase
MPSFAPSFLERLNEIFGTSLTTTVVKTFVERPTTFRVNTLKVTREEVLEKLQQEGFKLRRVPWFADAFILDNKKLSELQKLSLYQEGKIYVQSLASMVPPVVLAPKAGEKVLDLTAAPGSKASQMAALMKNTGELVANDNNEIRFQRLEHTMRIMGVGQTGFLRLENCDGWKLTEKYPLYFDKVLIDVPCTAEARFVSGEPRTFSFWNERNIKEHAFIQKKLLFAGWEMLKPGGTLVYSTCTFAPEENERQISRFITEVGKAVSVEPIALSQLQLGPIMKMWKEEKILFSTQKTLRIVPTKDIEGFYVAKLRKVL